MTRRPTLTAAMRPLLCAALLPILIGANPARTGEPAPPDGAAPPARESLLDKALRYEQAVYDHHLHDGVVMPRALLAPEGRADRSTGHPEDGAANTGDFLAALAFKYAVTKDPADRARAAQVFAGVENLERVTGIPGLFARNLKNTGGWTVDEEWFFFPQEWRDSPAMPGYRYLGDVSSDQLSHLLLGCAVYFDFAADAEAQARIAGWVERVYGRVLANGLRIIDADGKITLWGNFAPDQPHQELNSLLALAHLRLAHHVTGDEKYLRQYRRCIRRHDYLRHALLASVNEPEKYIVSWDDTLAFGAFYTLLRHEDDPAVRDQLLRAMERYWIRVRFRHRSFYDFVYQVYHPERVTLTQASVRELLQSDIRPRRYASTLRTAAGPMTLEGTWQESPADELLAYWLARAHGLLDADETGIALLPEGASYRRPPDPRPPPPLPELIDYVPDPAAEPAAEGPAPRDAARRAADTPRGMVLVPAGEFRFGSRHGDSDEVCEPAVQSTGAFWIDRYEVTVEQFARVMGRPLPDEPLERRKPAVVRWSEADAYAKRLGKRLPTEREWEKAARGTDGRTFPWGEVFDWSFVAWDDAEPVGCSPAGVSPYGCFDMAGNVWEWTADDYGPYPRRAASTGFRLQAPGSGPGKPRLDPEARSRGPEAMPRSAIAGAFAPGLKVARGGAGFNQRAMLRCAYRGAFLPESAILGHKIGFRCVRDAAPAPASGGEEF